ncbi:hypothetical protein AVEN_151715-1 [Araneus ventricosus]|uniref:Uncharacterized protein n=1 Tax=Araneus ventricosus TaxID=182803 RepID=A0A4Y2DMY2_ARAVE|nr:hypothetical protein AVEN_151715-1 [Araneus ventricosus]
MKSLCVLKGRRRVRQQKVQQKIFSAYPSLLKIVPISPEQFFPAWFGCLGGSFQQQGRWDITKDHEGGGLAGTGTRGDRGSEAERRQATGAKRTNSLNTGR